MCYANYVCIKRRMPIYCFILEEQNVILAVLALSFCDSLQKGALKRKHKPTTAKVDDNFQKH